MMKSVFAASLIAIVVVICLTPLVRLLALRLGAVARPGGRHVHQLSIPRLGGLAITVAFYAAPLRVSRLGASGASVLAGESTRLWGLVGGGVAMCAVGVVDDTRGIRAIHKLL